MALFDSPAKAGLCTALITLTLLVLSACKPFWDEIDKRAMGFVKTAIVSPNDMTALGKIANHDNPGDLLSAQPTSTLLNYLWARHEQGVVLDYSVGEKRSDDASHQLVVVVVSEEGKPILGKFALNYYFDIHFEKDQENAWHITRIQAR